MTHPALERLRAYAEVRGAFVEFSNTDAANAAYHGLSALDARVFRDLIGSPLGLWPVSLRELALKRVVELGLCGEVLAETVAAWIKNGGCDEDRRGQPSHDEVND
jgi:hypothetical protein